MKRVLLLLGFPIWLTIAGCTHSQALPSIKAKPTPTQASPYVLEIPEIPDRQDLVPVTLYFHNPLTRGDKVTVKVNSGSTVAFELLVEGDYEITAFGGRIRTEGTGPIYCTVTRRNGETVTLSQMVKILISNNDNILKIPESPSGANQLKTQSGNGRFDFAFSVENNMARHGHIRQIVLNGAKGVIKLALTPYTAANPLFIFDSPSHLADLTINVAQ